MIIIIAESNVSWKHFKVIQSVTSDGNDDDDDDNEKKMMKGSGQGGWVDRLILYLADLIDEIAWMVLLEKKERR